jgi:predicted butyrate kinase (DUF1464 family)
MGGDPQSHYFDMSEETKNKVGIFGNRMYKVFMSLGVFTLIFNGGVWKNGIEVKIFESAQEKFEVIDQVEENEEDIDVLTETVVETNNEIASIHDKQEKFDGNVQEIIKAIDDLDKKVQWNFNRINNQ